MGTWRTLHPRRILHSPGAISVHDSFHQASLEPEPSGQELSTLPTRQLQPLDRLVFKTIESERRSMLSLLEINIDFQTNGFTSDNFKYILHKEHAYILDKTIRQ